MQKFLKILHIFNYYLKHSTKNNRKHLKVIIKNNLFSKQILKKELFSIKKFLKFVF